MKSRGKILNPTLRDLVVRLARANQQWVDQNKSLMVQIEAVSADLQVMQSQLAEVRADSQTDPLTGLVNREGLDRAVSSALASAGSKPFAVAIIDVDNFKNINDTYGHQAGDAILRHIGRALQSTVRNDEVIARLGGDEFLAILRVDTGQAGVVVAERLRKSVLACDTAHTKSRGG